MFCYVIVMLCYVMLCYVIYKDISGRGRRVAPEDVLGIGAVGEGDGAVVIVYVYNGINLITIIEGEQEERERGRERRRERGRRETGEGGSNLEGACARSKEAPCCYGMAAVPK